MCQLFEGMKLGSYTEALRNEQVSGDILAEFDESVLRDELNISSRIQQIRVMKVIQGHHSAKELLNK